MRIEIPDFAAARVLVCGDVMLDRYWSGDTARISPEAPVPVVRVGAREQRPGGAANVALNMAALGAGAALVGVIGRDDGGRALGELLDAAGGIDAALVEDPDAATVTKLRVLSRHQQLIRLDFEQPEPGLDGGRVLPAFERALAVARAVVLSDYAKGTLSRAGDLIAAARGAGTPVLVDPKGRDFERYEGADAVTPNLAEFEAVAGRCRDEAELVERARAVAAEHAIGALLVTRGEHGMTLVPAAGEAVHIPAQAREVFDVTGAGDTVIATLGAAVAAGAGLEQAARLANLAAGVVVAKLGAATVSVPELRRALVGLDGSGQGVVDEAALLTAVADARAHGERIVMTNGCFDLLHAGHVAYLEEARAHGDRLIVAVNDDASVARLKGGGRPVTPLADRMAVVAGLSAVDWVVPFAEDTPERLVCAVRPDVLVKGGDYGAGAVAGRECAGEVRIVDYREGRSSSAIIEAIRAARGDSR